MEQKKPIPSISSRLRHHILEVPNEARRVSGIVINGRRIKTLVFTTDIAIIRNCSADAVLAVYPFTPQPTISDAILRYSSLPVFCGVGGGTTQGIRTTQLAWDAEAEGAMGVVVNAPMGNLDIERICKYTHPHRRNALPAGRHPAHRGQRARNLSDHRRRKTAF